MKEEEAARLRIVNHWPCNDQQGWQKLTYLAAYLFATRGSLKPEECPFDRVDFLADSSANSSSALQPTTIRIRNGQFDGMLAIRVVARAPGGDSRQRPPINAGLWKVVSRDRPSPKAIDPALRPRSRRTGEDWPMRPIAGAARPAAGASRVASRRCR